MFLAAPPRFAARLGLAAELDREFRATFAMRACAEMHDSAIRMMKSADLAAFDLTKNPRRHAPLTDATTSARAACLRAGWSSGACDSWR